MAVCYFEPSASSARACRQDMETALWSSVGALLADQLPDDHAALPDKPASTSLLDFGAYSDIRIEHPADGKMSPGVVAQAQDYLLARMTGASRPTVVEATPAFPIAMPAISCLSLDTYSSAQIETLRRWWDIDPGNALCLMAVSPDRLHDTRAQIALAFERMKDCAPELYDETLVTIRDIIVALPGAATGLELGGASSFALWGALAINPDTQDDDGWVHYFKTIAHEAGHNLLFALARSEPLVRNNIDDTYSSPLRSDPRPMDGIFHAGFVSARESYALDKLLTWHENTGGLCARDAELAEAFFENAVIAFWQCSEILRKEADLAALGEAILADCERFMREEFTVLTG
jgi:hypothetical protein